MNLDACGSGLALRHPGRQYTAPADHPCFPFPLFIFVFVSVVVGCPVVSSWSFMVSCRAQSLRREMKSGKDTKTEMRIR